MTDTVLAHGVGTRSDLPIPTWLALYGAGTIVLITFLSLVLLWRKARLADGDVGLPLPQGAQHVLTHPAVRTTCQALVLAVALLVTYVALTGPTDPPSNIAPWAVYVTFWVGLVPASILLGPVWHYLNPLRLLLRPLRAITGPAPSEAGLDRMGMWPAAVTLSAFVWLELVYPDRALPSTVGIFLVLYGVAMLVGGLWYGERWFERADAFEVYSTLVARLSPWGVRGDGRWVLRNPLRNAATLPAVPGLSAVVVVLVGSTAFDGLSRTQYWTSGPGAANDTTSGTLGLVVMIGVTGLLYLLGTRGNGWVGRSTHGPALPSAFAHTVIPIAIGYAVAHYFSLLLLDGQTTWILASNPLALDGVDLFGTYGNAIDYTLLSTSTIAYVQVGAVVIGHVLGVLLAHDRSLRDTTGRARSLDQLPLVAVMVAYTVGGLGLLFGA